MKKEYDKLVRDNIPEIIMNSGSSCKVKKVTGTQLKAYIYDKINEELNEFKEAYDKNDCPNMFEEILDIVTITLAYFKENNQNKRYDDPDVCPYTLDDFIKAIGEKINNKGNFNRGYVLLEVDE